MNAHRITALFRPYVLLLLLMGGCARSHYLVEVRDSQTKQPIPNATVTLFSVPRMRSFLDPRHYLVGCGQSETEQGVTDAAGKVELALPSDLHVEHITVNDVWANWDPSGEWPDAQRRDGLEADEQPPCKADKPEVRLHRK